MKTFAEITGMGPALVADGGGTQAKIWVTEWLRQYIPGHEADIYPTPEDALSMLLSLKNREISHLTSERNKLSTLHTSAIEKLREREQEVEQLKSDKERLVYEASVHVQKILQLTDDNAAFQNQSRADYDDLKDSKASWLEREHNLVKKIEQLRASLTRTRGIVAALVADWIEAKP